jgi:hypothetical protein
VANRAVRRQQAPTRTYDLKLSGDLADFHVKMKGMPGSMVLDLRSGLLKEADLIERIADSVVEHDFDVDSIAELDMGILLDIVKAWGVAMRDRANPPAIGEP